MTTSIQMNIRDKEKTMKTQIKIDRLKNLISKLEEGGQVTPRDLRALLSKDDLEEIKLAWDEEKSSRDLAKPPAIKKYEKLLQTACSYYGLMEKYSSEISRNEYLTAEFSNKADAAFEYAIDFIREAEDGDENIQFWIDRDIYGEIEYDPTSIPRVIGSKTYECQVKRKSPFPLQTKREVKLQVLEEILKRMVGDFEGNSLEAFMVEIPDYKSARNRALQEFTGFSY